MHRGYLLYILQTAMWGITDIRSGQRQNTREPQLVIKPPEILYSMNGNKMVAMYENISESYRSCIVTHN